MRIRSRCSLRQLGERAVHVDAVCCRDRRADALVVRARGVVRAHGAMAPSGIGLSGCRDRRAPGRPGARPDPVAARARAVGAVEREVRGCSSSKESPHWLTGEVLAERQRRPSVDVDQGDAPASRSAVSSESGAVARFRPCGPGGPRRPRCVLEVAFELDVLGQVPDLAVDPGPAEALLRARSFRSASYSPLRPRTTGASTWNRVPSSSSRI